MGGVVQVSEMDHQFFVFHFFHVDLVQILQGSKIPLGDYGPAGPDSTRPFLSYRKSPKIMSGISLLGIF